MPWIKGEGLRGRPLFALAIVALCASSSPVSAQTLRIYHIDVEQADAALLVMPNGKTLLIDSGKNGHGSRIKAAMDRAGVTQIDAFVASHYHEDHFGGIDDLVELGVPVLESYDRGDKECCLPATKRVQQTFIDYQATVGEDAHTLRAGGVIYLDPLVTITAISSGGDVVGRTNPVLGRDENDMSISLLITFRGFRAFFGGDLESPTEDAVAAGNLVMDVDLYKANHHGSDTSSSSGLLADMKPSLIVVSNGSNGTYHHPRSAILSAYGRLAPPPTILQTNKCLLAAPCGNVSDSFIADPETKDQDGTIEIAVDGATGRYTATWGTSNRIFPVKAPEMGLLVATSTVVISRLLPNPVGSDEQNEAVTLTNKGTVSVSLVGWTLKDRSGATWNLAGSLGPGASRTFRRNGQAMSLNNAGDEIALIDGAGAEADQVTYSAAAEGIPIEVLDDFKVRL